MQTEVLEKEHETALKLGASMEEIMEVLKLCVAAGVESFHQAMPILAEELDRAQLRGST